MKAAGFRSALLLGMGGSSLCPEVLSKTFGPTPGCPELFVLDSTVPAQVKSFENKVDLRHTLFIVSSKSGGTTEPNAFKQYFFDLAQKAAGDKPAGSQFIAITDHGTKLHQLAEADGFRHVLHGVPSIGGRYSALSNFGILPAAIMGIDVLKFLDRAELMVKACGPGTPLEANPGAMLGVVLGTLAKRGRDKVTIVSSPGLSALGAWLEQLVAESVGKEGKGIVPVDGEIVGSPEVYGGDRVFVYQRLLSAPDRTQDEAVAALQKAGHPVIHIGVEEPMNLGGEFFRWEIATAVAGAIVGVNPFDQPDVEASKVATRKLTGDYEKTGQLPREDPIVQDGALTLFTDPDNAKALASEAASGKEPDSAEAVLASHLKRIGAGDYFGINAYVEMNDENQRELAALRQIVRDDRRVATTLGFGPRFLHSTGQLHKGGPNTGVFLQITAEDGEDLPVPGQKYTFGVLKRFQAQGDFEVLAERKRRALRVHLGPDVQAGLARLREIVQRIAGQVPDI